MNSRALLILLLVFLLAGCTATGSAPTATRAAMQTEAVATALAGLTLAAPSPSPTPSLTPVPLLTPTPLSDLTAIKFESLYFNGTAETVLTFALHGARAGFSLTGNEHLYSCQILTDAPDALVCRGLYQPPDHLVTYRLYAAGIEQPLLEWDMIIPSAYPPTPIGMLCEIEPLWVAPLTGPEGCYAVTCYAGGAYYDGTANTCDDPWRWPIP